MPEEPTLTEQNATDEFCRAFPELAGEFLEELGPPEEWVTEDDPEGHPPFHNAFSWAFAPLWDALGRGTLTAEEELLLLRALDFINRMLVDGDESMEDVATATLVEHLSDFWLIEKYFGVMPAEVERWIRMWRNPSPN